MPAVVETLAGYAPTRPADCPCGAQGKLRLTLSMQRKEPCPDGGCPVFSVAPAQSGCPRLTTVGVPSSVPGSALPRVHWFIPGLFRFDMPGVQSLNMAGVVAFQFIQQLKLGCRGLLGGLHHQPGNRFTVGRGG